MSKDVTHGYPDPAGIATLRSNAVLGIGLVAALLALARGKSAVNTWLSIIVLSVILDVGLLWSIVWQRLSGQATVDDVER